MKILFAISNENVLNKIVDSYRNKYGEAISFKNVFYFNAIIREIQKDKTYDRIVISEDLEPFSNNNYDIIDKFIVERLKEISTEIASNGTRKTDVIIICTDRRTKSSFVLTKMFEYKIYNALVGTDRRIDNVCDLIYNPRTELEAKEYYKVEGTAENQTVIDDVSEQEMQNILIHYKKLGKNEDRYADSFNNIASQYTDKQLRIIIKCLPINVRAVLEAECPKYQELVTYAGGETENEKKAKEKIQEQRKLEQIEQERKLKDKIEKEKARNVQKNTTTPWNANIPSTQKEPELPSGIDILDQKRNQARMTGNVIVPNSMNIRSERKIYSDEQVNQIQNTPRQGRMGDITTQEPQKSIIETIPEPQRVIKSTDEDLLSGFDDYNTNAKNDKKNLIEDMQLPGLDDIELPENPVTATTQEEVTLPGFEDIILPQEPIRPAQLQMEEVASQPEIAQEPKRGRGRPRKNPIEPPKPKGKRGRPRKNPLPEEVNEQREQLKTQNIQKEEIQQLPGLDDFEDILNEPTVAIPEKIVSNVLPETATLSGMDEEDISLPGLDIENDENDILSSLPGLEDTETLEDDDLISSSISRAENSDFEEPQRLINSNMFENMQEATNNQFGKDAYSSDKYVPPSMSRINTQEEQISQYSPSQDRIESIKKLEENRVYSTGSLNTVLTKDKKIVAFVGASKSGTSFLVNNLACLFASLGVKTAILDMTKNKNSYYIYTNNDENLRNVAYTSIEKLENGVSEPIRIDRNLEVYTAMPNDGKDYSNTEAILSTLVQNSSLVLIDCDFNTDFGYFANSQEIYLVQSMDILTIQELTGFLRDLKTKGILDQEKLRVVVNKELKVRNLSSKAVIGGMSFYNDPAMSYMTELFNKDKIRACTIPFDENVYSRYLEGIVNCVISINGYPKGFINNLKILGNMVYPLLSRQTYSTQQRSQAEINYGNNFSAEMSNTLNQMRNKY